MMQKQQIVLASSSNYRRQLLAKLPINFITAAPNIDESAIANETPNAMALRLAETKARALNKKFNHHLIIASDQVAICNQQQLSKPGNHQRTCEQLSHSSGNLVTFYTSVCVLNTSNNKLASAIDQTKVWFKTLTPAQIKRYVDLEPAYDCAGGFKVEGLGIALLDRIETEDPNALIGLPMIKLIKLLNQFNVSIL